MAHRCPIPAGAVSRIGMLDKWRNCRTYLVDYIRQQKAERLTADLLAAEGADQALEAAT